MGLKKSFLLLSLSCLAVAFLLLGAVIFLCRGIENHYPLGGVEILSDGSVVPLPSPTVSQQRILATLNIVQMVSCILFPVGGLIVSVFLFYYLKLKQPISCLQNGIMRIQNNDLDFSLPILSNDEMGQLCAAFEEMRSELLKSNRLLWQQAEERKRLNAAFSHDLRNPITVLKGSVKLLRQGIQDEQTIDRLESYTLRIEQYVEAMSSVQKLEQLSVKPKEIRLSVLQSELQETARLLALSKKVSVLVPSGGTVCIDHGLFLTVAENLIGNAARFAEKAISILIGQLYSQAIQFEHQHHLLLTHEIQKNHTALSLIQRQQRDLMSGFLQSAYRRIAYCLGWRICHLDSRFLFQLFQLVKESVIDLI